MPSFANFHGDNELMRTNFFHASKYLSGLCTFLVGLLGLLTLRAFRNRIFPLLLAVLTLCLGPFRHLMPVLCVPSTDSSFLLVILLHLLALFCDYYFPILVMRSSGLVWCAKGWGSEKGPKSGVLISLLLIIYSRFSRLFSFSFL